MEIGGQFSPLTRAAFNQGKKNYSLLCFFFLIFLWFSSHISMLWWRDEYAQIARLVKWVGSGFKCLRWAGLGLGTCSPGRTWARSRLMRKVGLSLDMPQPGLTWAIITPKSLERCQVPRLVVSGVGWNDHNVASQEFLIKNCEPTNKVSFFLKSFVVDMGLFSHMNWWKFCQPIGGLSWIRGNQSHPSKYGVFQEWYWVELRLGFVCLVLGLFVRMAMNWVKF